MKPKNRKELREKEIRKIHKRLDEISKEERNLELIKLDEPYRHGWFKELIITNNIDKYSNKEYIEEVYRLVEKKVWAKTKEEAEKKWKHQISKHLISKDIPSINRKQYNKLSVEAKELCIPFQYYTEKKKLRTRYYIKIPKGAYKIKFTRAYVTHTRNIDTKLQRERILLFQKLERKGYYEAEKKLFPWKSDWPNFRESRQEAKKKVRMLKKIEIKDFLKEAC